MYCKVGEDSDVTAYFHMMGHLVCETCDVTFRSKSGLKLHLEEHRDRGDRVPQSGINQLQDDLDWMVTQCALEGRNSIRRPKPLSLMARALLVIINP